MRDEPGRAWTCPPRVVARAGRLARHMTATRLIPTGLATHKPRATRLATHRPLTTGLATAGLVITGVLLATGCGAGPAAAFRPAGASTGARANAGPATGAGAAGRTGNLASPAQRAAGPLNWAPVRSPAPPPLPGWAPADPGEVPAVIAAKDFLLAFLYAEYRGNQDDRWTGYASGQVLSALKANLSEPSVTTESFTGTIIFSHMRAFPDPATAGAIDVSECFDNAGSRNTDLASGKSIPDRIPASQHYYMNTDVMASTNGQWRVISVYPVVYYPQAQECKP
jgi:hypothetical protein